MVKFYNGRKLILKVKTNNPSSVIREMQTNNTFCGKVYEWTRYKIV